MNIKLSKKLQDDFKNGYVKTLDVIKFILETVENTLTDKEVCQTSIADISFGGKHCTDGYYDILKNELILIF